MGTAASTLTQNWVKQMGRRKDGLLGDSQKLMDELKLKVAC
ncbi:hypothetical protein [Dyadobacter sp. SG02]|nr:hypothetical protein [Dyadobacter sp. SG02]